MDHKVPPGMGQPPAARFVGMSSIIRERRIVGFVCLSTYGAGPCMRGSIRSVALDIRNVKKKDIIVSLDIVADKVIENPLLMDV